MLLIKDYKLSLYLNIAVCSLKTKQFPSSISACEESLRLDNRNVKAYYLRARSWILDINSGVDELKLAIDDLWTALMLNPGHKTIKEQLAKV